MIIAHNTVMKYLTNFKKIVMICAKNGWLERDLASNVCGTVVLIIPNPYD